MLPIIWTQRAEERLLAIVEFIAERNQLAAARLGVDLRDSTLPLADFPMLFRQSDRIKGCREIVVHSNYIVLYRVRNDSILIVSVTHASRKY